MSSSIDSLYTNAFERALNTDQNLDTTLVGRSIAEALRMLVGAPSFLGHQSLAAVDANLFNMETRSRVFGLAVEAINSGARTFAIGAGALLSDTGAEAATADDSSFRLGLNLATTAVAFPAADDLWHLLECRVINTNVSEARDILTNPITRTYAPQSVVKRKLKQLAFQITTGTGSAIPAPTAGWTPLYGFVIPTAGAAIPVMSQVVDLRPCEATRTENEEDGAFKGLALVTSRELQTTSSIAFPGSSQSVAFRFAAEIDGRKLYAQTVGAAVDITRFLSGGGSPVDTTWYYIYLAPPPSTWGTGNAGNACWGGRQEAIVSNCVLLLSSSAPRTDGRNSAALACVAPFSGASIAIGDAVCVGCLLQEPGGLGWDPMSVTRAGRARISSVTTAHSVAPSTLGGQAQGVTTLSFLPINMVKVVEAQFGMGAKTPSQSPGGSGGRLLVTPSASGVTAISNLQAFGSILIDPLMQEWYQGISFAVDEAGLASSTGQLTYKVETRDSEGVIYGVDGLLSEVCNAGASLVCRVTGFDM